MVRQDCLGFLSVLGPAQIYPHHLINMRVIAQMPHDADRLIIQIAHLVKDLDNQQMNKA